MDYANDSATEKTELKWYNKKLNGITLPKLPLLKEANFCNIALINATALDFTASEKLENFRATGSSNITSIDFADGVALNTLYIPPTLSSLSLVQANLLEDLIFPENSVNELAVHQKRYSTPVEDETGNLVAASGLYLEKFFEEGSSLDSINFNGGNLGYNSYVILQRLFDKNNDSGAKVTMTDVNWCPYTKLSEGDIYNPNLNYYKDNGHYGFTTYNLLTAVDASDFYDMNKTYYTEEDEVYSVYTGGLSNFSDAIKTGLYTFDEKQFNADILSELVYYDNNNGGRKDDGSFSNIITSINDASVQMLKTLYTQDKFKNFSGQGNPELTGLIYIHNSTQINEADVVELQSYYPHLTFFFKDVKPAYSAKFVIFDPENYSEKYVKWANGSTSPSVQKIQSYSEDTYFSNPFNDYKPEKTHYDFIGWSLDNRNPYDEEGNLLDSVITIDEANTWGNQRLQEEKIDYIYYAIFELHKYEIRCYNNNDESYGDYTDDKGNKYHLITIEYGQPMHTDGIIMPKALGETALEERNAFRGWTLNKTNGKVYDKGVNLSEIVIDLSRYSVIKNYDLYAVFQSESVYDNVTDNKYFNFTYSQTGYPIINLNPELANTLVGKITLPAKNDKGEYIQGIGTMMAIERNSPIGLNITHIFFEKNNEYKYVEKSAFDNIKNTEDRHQLYGVYLPEGIVSIGDYGFHYLQSLQEVTLSEGLTYIGTEAFAGNMASYMNKVNCASLPSTVTYLGEKCFHCSNVSFTELPKGITKLPERCFFGCPNVRIDTFGSPEGTSLTEIGKECFEAAGHATGAIDRIRLHQSVIKLGSECFAQYGSNVGPTQIYTTLAENDPNRQSWDAEVICGNANATINTWSGVDF